MGQASLKESVLAWPLARKLRSIMMGFYQLQEFRVKKQHLLSPFLQHSNSAK
jgi:hypothetical protein